VRSAAAIDATLLLQPPQVAQIPLNLQARVFACSTCLPMDALIHTSAFTLSHASG
jgi:hypothetical protein